MHPSPQIIWYLGCRHFHVLVPLLEELQPLLLPPEQSCLQPIGLQRFRAYFQLVNDALEALLSTSSLEGAPALGQNPADLISLDAASTVVLQLAAQLCQAMPSDKLSEVCKGSIVHGFACVTAFQTSAHPFFCQAATLGILLALLDVQDILLSHNSRLPVQTCGGAQKGLPSYDAAVLSRPY